MHSKNDLFEDMASALELLTKSYLEAVTDANGDLSETENQDAFISVREALRGHGTEKADVEQVLLECLTALSVSFLTILDGGTELSEKGRLYLVDENNNRIGEGLHEEFIGYLIDTGRLNYL